jgi:hypothetical protein
VSVFVQLSSNGRTGILSMVIFWRFAQGPGAQFAFFVLGSHLYPRLELRTFFSFCLDLCIGRRREKDEKRNLKGKEIKIKQSKKDKNKKKKRKDE